MKVSKAEKMFFKNVKNKKPLEVVKIYRKVGFPFRKTSSIKSNFQRYKKSK